MYTGEGKGGPNPLGRKAVPHDTPFFFFLILNIIYFHLSDILIFLITLSLTMSYIDTQGMSLPSSNKEDVITESYSPRPFKKMTVFTDMERKELKQMMREVLDEYLS